jgi:hypothetical protein
VRGKPLADDVDLDRLAQGSAGRSGADLAELIRAGSVVAAVRAPVRRLALAADGRAVLTRACLASGSPHVYGRYASARRAQAHPSLIRAF